MSALARLALAASFAALGTLAPPRGAQGTLEGAAPEVHGTLTAAPGSAEVGEPVVLELTLVHAANTKVRLSADALRADESWVHLGWHGAQAELVSWTEIDANDPSRATTRARWKICSLEPGSRELPQVEIKIGADGIAQMIAAGEARLEVRGVLADGEDAPRPPKEFRPVPGEPVSASWPWIVGVGLAVVALALLALRRPKAKAAAQPRPTPLQRLQALEMRELDRPETVQEVFYELTHSVRVALDLRAARDRSGLTDVEWVASAGAELAPESRSALEELFSECAEVKYGTARPTQWAVRDALAKARAIVSAQELALQEASS